MHPTLLISVVVFLLAACGGDRRVPDESKTPAAAPKTVQAGEHHEGAEEVDFCGEHGVPEAMCTKCNPDLIAGFKEKGDWCGEHGFPESVCPICNPVDGAPKVVVVEADGAPADKTRLCLKSPEAAGLAGVETSPAVARSEGASIAVPMQLAFDATRRAVVNARAPGVVKALHADLGARVEKGARLAMVDSAMIGADRARIQGARARVAAADANYKREKELQGKGVSSAKEVLAAQQELQEARAEEASYAASIGAVGASAGGTGGYTVSAPLAGWVTRRAATIGEMVDAEETLFEIVDTSSMWAELAVPEDQLDQVAMGQSVIVTVDGLKGRQFEGTISYVSPEVDARTRTVQARAGLKNQEGRLRANMFGEARIVLGARGEAVTVPADAVQRVKDVFFVYVQTRADEFEVRRVAIGAKERGVVELTAGVAAGDKVVVRGGFALKAETLKDTMGDGCVDD